MTIEIITKEDLQVFKTELLNELKEIFQHNTPQQSIKPWLKNTEVIKLLKISASKLQRLRIAGHLKSTKVGSIHYYRYDDIEKLLSGNKKC